MADEFKHLSAGTSLTQGEYEAVGGHVFACQAAGDILYASSSSQLSRIGKGTNGEILQQASCKPDWTDSPSLNALTVDDVNINGKVVTLTGSACDTIVMTAAANGAFSLVTTDTAAAAANIQITADGTVDIDSAGVLTLDSGAAINIEPAACSAILLDGTISIDGAAITGATSILATDIKIGEDDETKVDFADANIINLHANNIKALSVHNTSSKGELRFYEDANYVGFAAPALSGDQIWALPDEDGSCGQALVTDGCGVLSWASAGGARTVAGTTDNGIVTFVNSGSTFAAEAGLTFNATTLSLQTDTGTGNTAGLNIMNSGAASACRKSFIRFAQNRTTGGETATAWLWGNLSTISCSGYRGNLNFATASNGAPTRHVVMDSYGMVHVNGCANASMTQGVSICQGSNDNHIFSLQSCGDVVHGMTTISETDVYAFMKKNSPGAGGLDLYALNDSGSVALSLIGLAVANNSTKGGAGNGPINLRAALKCGTGTKAFSANDNMVYISDFYSGSTKFIFDADGDIHVDGSTSLSAFDDYCDVELLTAAKAVHYPECHDFRKRFSGFIEEYAQVLHDNQIVTMNDDGHHFISYKGMMGLTIDSIRQLHGRIETLETQLTALNGGK